MHVYVYVCSFIAAAATSASNAAFAGKGSAAPSSGGKDSAALMMQQPGGATIGNASQPGFFPAQGLDPNSGLYASQVSPQAAVAHQAALWSQMTLQQQQQQQQPTPNQLHPTTQHLKQSAPTQQSEREQQNQANFLTALSQQQQQMLQQQQQVASMQQWQGVPTLALNQQQQELGLHAATAQQQAPQQNMRMPQTTQQQSNPIVPPPAHQPPPYSQQQELSDTSTVHVVDNGNTTQKLDGRADSSKLQYFPREQYVQNSPHVSSAQSVGLSSGGSYLAADYASAAAPPATHVATGGVTSVHGSNTSESAAAAFPPQQQGVPHQTLQQPSTTPDAVAPSADACGTACSGDATSAMSNSSAVGIFSDIGERDPTGGSGDARLGKLYSLFSQ